jgi:hypothetical protein
MDEAGRDTGKQALFSAIEELIATATPDRREALRTTIEAYARDFPEDFLWAVGTTAPALLHRLLKAIASGCRPADLLPPAERHASPLPAAGARVHPGRAREIAASVRPAAPSQVRSVYGLPELW